MHRLVLPLSVGLSVPLACKDPPPPTQTSNAAPAPAAPAVDEPTPAAAPPRAVGETRTWTFDDDDPGRMPKGIRAAETGSQGTPATWQVVLESGTPTSPHAFGVTRSPNDKRTYNLALVEGTAYADIDISVMVRASGGVLNQGGGPIWRVADPDNYYIARWDPVEDNAYLYVMQGGVRSALAKVDIELDEDDWHALRVVMEGTHMELFIDDKPVLEADDSSLSAAGMIGLWTKSDATTRFDDLSVTTP